MIFGSPASLRLRAAVGRPLGRAFARLLHFALLAFEVLFGVADVALGHPLGLVDHFLVQCEIASVEEHFATMQLRYAVHPVEQHPVVTDQQQASGEVVKRVIQLVPRVDVEVVGRLVEQ